MQRHFLRWCREAWKYSHGRTICKNGSWTVSIRNTCFRWRRIFVRSLSHHSNSSSPGRSCRCVLQKRKIEWRRFGSRYNHQKFKWLGKPIYMHRVNQIFQIITCLWLMLQVYIGCSHLLPAWFKYAWHQKLKWWIL